MIQSASDFMAKLGGFLGSIEVTDSERSGLSLDAGTDVATKLILSVGQAGGKVVVVGNGGSAAIASHLQNDLCHSLGIRALVFNEPPLLTALSNDHGYDTAFETLSDLWLDSGDLLVAISSSGQSSNILGAVRAAQACDARVITLSGFKPDNPLRGVGGDVNFYVGSGEYGFVEVVHSVLAHLLTDLCIPLQREKQQ